ncbi:DUF1761 domain-containing protein [Pseudoalteromonas rubra]|uniref:DUF1761 domain-containing protein n=1 Tax=Pseudoalteromonas rubra TaxID=43658 RepID=A0A5S3X4K3_9GAMM|nr:DUF1761 domain-containing protein [Pseudoalteromonas rubra]TMP39502.1 DUF1761 domain-containing protein [Pseudoalteromonas rubra]
MTVFDVDVVAVVIAAVSSFALGGIWYSPLLFHKSWLEGAGLTDLDIQNADHKLIFSGAMFLSILAAFLMAALLGKSPAILDGVLLGLAVGVCFVASTLGTSYLFEQRPLKLFLINAGYHTAQFCLIGFVLGILS